MLHTRQRKRDERLVSINPLDAIRHVSIRLTLLLAGACAWFPLQAADAGPPPARSNCRDPFSRLAALTSRQCMDQAQPAPVDIDLAKQRLLRLGLASPADFAGVEIRWCAMRAPGMTPEPTRVFLNPDLAAQPDALAATLAGQLHHVRQFRQLGTEAYVCQSSKDLVAARKASVSALSRGAQEAKARALAALQKERVGKAPSTGGDCRPAAATASCSAGAAPPLPGLCKCGAWSGPVPP